MQLSLGWIMAPSGNLHILILETCEYYLVVVQLLNCVWLIVTPWTAAHQVSLSFTISWSLLKFTSIELVMLSNNFILCHLLLLLLSIVPRIRVFSIELALRIRWLKYWSFSFSISPSNEMQGWFSLGLTGLILPSKGLSRVISSTIIQKQQFFGAQHSLWSNSYIHYY